MPSGAMFAGWTLRGVGKAGNMWWIIGGAAALLALCALAAVARSSRISEDERKAFRDANGYWPDW